LSHTNPQTHNPVTIDKRTVEAYCYVELHDWEKDTATLQALMQRLADEDTDARRTHAESCQVDVRT